jgi:hypothetical protein
MSDPPFFYFHSNCGKVCPIFLAYLIQLDVNVTGNITAKLCEVGSEFNIFCTLVTMATATIFNLFNIVEIFTVVCGSFWRVD